jgi:hypothetical protein
MGTDRARNWLGEYQGLKFEYDTWAEQLEMRENDQYLPAIPDSDGSKRTPTPRSDRMANATVRRMEFEDETAEEIAEIKAKMKAIETAIKALPDPMHRGVLIQRYVAGFDGYKLKPWRHIAIQLYRQDEDSALKRVQRIHREALEKLEEITDEENNLLL